MISETQKYINFFRGSAMDPAGGAYSTLPRPLAGGEGAHYSLTHSLPHPKNPISALASAVWALLERAPSLPR